MKTHNRLEDIKCDENSMIHRYPVTSSSRSFLPVTINRFESTNSIHSTQLTFNSIDEFFEVLKQWSTRKVASKEANFLISPATFKTTTGKSRADVDYASILIIDVDGGDMTPEDFQSIFPFTKMCLFSTFTDADNRYRAIFPLSLKVTADAYRDIVKSVIAAVQKSMLRYVDSNTRQEDPRRLPRHGIDPASKKIEMIYYAPCQSDNPSRSFFITQDGLALDVLDLLRNPIHSDLVDTAKGSTKELSPVLEKLPIDPNVAHQIAIAKQEYKALQPDCGLRNQAFFNIAQRMWWLGIRDVSRIEAELIDADHDRARERKGHIKSTMRFVRKLEAQWKMRA